MPIFGRYRVIDFALSSFMNAGIHDVGVIMQRDYQSLMDHIRNGKSWDMSRKDGGVRLLPPFGMPGYHSGNYFGTMEGYFECKKKFFTSGMVRNAVLNVDEETSVNILRDIEIPHLTFGIAAAADLRQNIPDSLLKFSAVFCSCHQVSHIQTDQPFIL